VSIYGYDGIAAIISSESILRSVSRFLSVNRQVSVNSAFHPHPSGVGKEVVAPCNYVHYSGRDH